jgi:predicted 2-oxoglutarate/Fe(II)-dependent dioxygenase YbiX
MRYLRHGAQPPAAVFVRRDFLDPDSCARLVEEMSRNSRTRAQLSSPDGSGITDTRRRATYQADVSRARRRLVAERLDALLPEIEGHFGLPLGPVQTPQFLHYRRGDFFRPHRDSSTHQAHGPDLMARRIAAVLFLNRGTRLPEPASYCGGELRLYRIDAEPADPGICITGEPGMLVAFPADVIHEVRPVTHGERFTVVTWYVRRAP